MKLKETVSGELMVNGHYKKRWYMGGIPRYNLFVCDFYIHPIDWFIRFYKWYRWNTMKLMYEMGIRDGLTTKPIEGCVISIPIMFYWLLTGEYRYRNTVIDCNV